MKGQGILTVYKGLPAGIYVIFFSRIVNSVGNLVYPFLSLYLTTKLGLGKADAGLFLTLSSVVYVPAGVIGGKIADHFGRKAMLVGGMAASALCLLPAGFAPTSHLVPWLLVASRFFGSLSDPAYSALIADLTTPDNRKASFSLLYLGHNIGFAVGPMIAGFLFSRNLPLLFIGDAATTLLSVALVALYVQESKRPSDTAEQEGQSELPEMERAETGSVLSVLLRRPVLVISSLLFLVYSLVYAQHIFSLPIQLDALYGAAGALHYGTMMSVNAVTVVALTSVITVLTVRFSPLTNMGLAGLALAVGFGMIYFVHSLPLLILSTVVWTVGEILQTVNSGVIMANNTPSSHRARISAAISIIVGAGWSFGPWLAGLWMQSHSVQSIWPIAFFLALGAAVLMFVLSSASSAREKAVAAES